MAKLKYDLYPGEIVILKATSVRHGFWAPYTDELVLTNQNVIWIKLGVLQNVKGVERFPLTNIAQAIVGKASNGEKQLEIYHDGEIDAFAFASDNDRELKIWAMAISDHMKSDSEYYDYAYYQKFYDDSIDEEIERESNNTSGVQLDAKFLGNVAKSVMKSGNYSVSGVMKGISKATKSQAKTSATAQIKQNIKDELGITEIEDEFTEIGNEFREMFGLKPKKTQHELKEERLNNAFNRKVATAREEVEQNRSRTTGSQKMSIDQQIETVKKLKDLLDAGVITPEEFEAKKKEILSI